MMLFYSNFDKTNVKLMKKLLAYYTFFTNLENRVYLSSSQKEHRY